MYCYLIRIIILVNLRIDVVESLKYPSAENEQIQEAFDWYPQSN